jgi:hypothetical protein
MPASAEQATFQQLQYRFAAHIRDPDHHPAPAGIELRRMRLYRELMFGNVAALLEQSFPVLRKILDDAQWADLVQAFFAHHRCTTPLFTELPHEFAGYLAEECPQHWLPWPFIPELAHYEWVELALALHEDVGSPTDINPDGDLLEQSPVLAPLVWRLHYHYPVHRIGPAALPTVPEDTHLLVHRDPSGEVRFVVINALSAELLALIESEPGLSGHAALEIIAARHPEIAPDAIMAGGASTLADLRAQGVLIGTRTPTPQENPA